MLSGLLRLALYLPSAPADVEAVPTGVALTVGLGAPTVAVVQSQSAAPAGVALALSLGAAAASVVQSASAAPAGIALALSLGAPTVTIAASGAAIPDGVALALSLGSPAATVTQSQAAAPVGVALSLTLGAASATVTQSAVAAPAGVALVLTLGAAAGVVTGAEPEDDDVILIPHPLVDGALAFTGELDSAAAIAAMAHEALPVFGGAITYYDQDRLMPFPSRIYGDNDIAGRIDLAALDPVTWGSGKAVGKTVTVFWSADKTLAATAIDAAVSMTAPETDPGVSGVYTYYFDGAAITEHLVGLAPQPVYLIVRVGQNYRVFATTTPDADTRPVGV